MYRFFLWNFFLSGVRVVLCSYLFCEHLRRILVTSIAGFARTRALVHEHLRRDFVIEPMHVYEF